MQNIDQEGQPQYGHAHSELGQISYGICVVSIPKIHKLGRLETPSILKLEFSPDPEKHIVLQKIENLEEANFLDRVKTSVAASVTKEAFIFIHGYKVSFEDAARRTGQIAFDLNFVGAPIFYSWPSYGKVADYTRDENNVIWSGPHFQRFVSLIAKHSEAVRIHIIAHSMGNRAVCDALKALSIDPTTNFKLNHLVLAAADIDADTFRELAVNLQKMSGRITLYESSKDKALLASRKIHGNARAGEPLLLVPGLDTIDASNVDTDFLAHSYFSDNWPLLSDIHSIFQNDELPASRFGLMEMDCEDGKYYAFKP
jgi:esterase/lipase superfamily enzyme